MNFDYCAAEYFVEYIGKYPGGRITYGDLKILRKWVGNGTTSDVSDYLDKESEQDSLFLFKKFPDIFVLKKDSLSLTDAFMSLYRPQASRKVKKFHNVNNNLENSIVRYFCKVLGRHGPRHFLCLLRVLMYNHYQLFVQFFYYCSVEDVYDFFFVHSNVFVLVKSVVYLSASIYSLSVKVKFSLGNTVVSSKSTLVVTNKLVKCVNFLLECFQSLHYMELRYCICYVEGDIEQILKNVSLVRQRELFESLPDTTMDVYGFLSLKKHDVGACVDDSSKIALLSVCILSFKKVILLRNLAAEVSVMMSSSRNCTNSITFEQQINFLKKFFQIHTSNTDNVGLSPKFTLPTCVFQLPSKCGGRVEEIENEIKLRCANLNHHDQAGIESVPSSSGTLDENHSKLSQKSQNAVLNTNLLSISGLSKAASERIRIAIIYLLKYFSPLVKKRVLETLLHALDDVRMSFCGLSETDEHYFITTCCGFIESATPMSSEDATIDGNAIVHVSEKEKLLLFIIYILTHTEEMHFLKLITVLKDNNIVSPLLTSSVSDQFRYFRTISEYVSIANDGYVTLSESFAPIESILEFYSDLFPDPKPVSASNALKGEKSCAVTESRIRKDYKSVLSENGDVSTETKAPDVSKLNDKESVTGFFPGNVFPKIILDMLYHCADFLRMYYKCTFSLDILKASVFSVAKVCDYFCTLSSCKKKMFIRNYYSYIHKKRRGCSASISENTKNILFTTHLLLKEKVIHYEKIVVELITIDENSSLAKRSKRLQYKYFRDAVYYFCINSDGFVTLRSSFYYVDSAVDTAFNSLTMSKRSSFVLNRRKLSWKDPKLESPKHASANLSERDAPNAGKETNESLRARSGISLNGHLEKNATDNISKPAGNNSHGVLIKSVSDTPRAKNGEFNSSVSVNEDNKSLKMPPSAVSEINATMKSVYSYSGVKNNILTENCKEMLMDGREIIQLHAIPNDVKNQVHFANRSQTESVSSDKAKLSSVNEASQECSCAETKNNCSYIQDTSFVQGYSKRLLNNYRSVSTQTLSPQPRTVSRLQSMNKCCSLSSNAIASGKNGVVPSIEEKRPADHDASQCDAFTDNCITVPVDSHLDSIAKNSFSGASPNTIEEREIVSEPSDIPMKSSDHQVDSYDAYIASLIDKHFNSVECSPDSTSGLTAPGFFNPHIHGQVPISERNCIFDESVCNKSPSIQNSSHCKDTAPLMTLASPSIPNGSASGLQALTPDSIESRAVNFFSIVLRDYEHYDCGFSVNFLKKHIRMASSEVQSFMREHYENDFLPFFQKHDGVFYVAMPSHNVYVLKKLLNPT